MPTASLQPSGVGPIEVAWGGLARPGAYLLVGSASHGRLELSTRIVGAECETDEPTLLYSAREPAAILSLARQSGVDVAAAGDRVHLKGVPLGAQLASLGEAGLSQMLDGVAESGRGSARVVVEDFTPFVRFRSFDTFGEAFRRLVDTVCQNGATLVLGLGEPANEGSRRLLSFVEGVVTGTVRVTDGGRGLHLIPGTGHSGDEHELAWSRSEAPAERPARIISAAQPPDDFRDHGADGYGGNDPATYDAGALVVSAVPSEPFGYPGVAPEVLPAPFGPDSLPYDAEESAPAPELPTLDSEGRVWATIQTVGAPAPGPAVPYTFDALSSGFLIDSDQPGMAAPPIRAQTDVAIPAPAPIPTAPAGPPGAADLVAEPDFGHADPEAGFTDDLTEAFAAGASAPFLVVALRIAGDSPYFDAFPTVADGLLGALTGRDRALVRDDEARMVVLLPHAALEAPQRLLAAVRAHLDSVLADRADDAMKSLAVLVLPDGKPFTDAQGLLAYVLA
jgi:hypothetical protein